MQKTKFILVNNASLRQKQFPLVSISQPGSRESLIRVPSKYEYFDTYQSCYQSSLITTTITGEMPGLSSTKCFWYHKGSPNTFVRQVLEK